MNRRSWYPEDPDSCLLLADAIVAAHLLVVLFIVVGQFAFLIGRFRRWSWVHNPWLRLTHLGLIAFVAGQAIGSIPCPMKVWENELRALGGDTLERASFVGYWAHELLYIHVSVVTLERCYIGFGVFVFATLFIVPIRWRRASGD